MKSVAARAVPKSSGPLHHFWSTAKGTVFRDARSQAFVIVRRFEMVYTLDVQGSPMRARGLQHPGILWVGDQKAIVVEKLVLEAAVPPALSVPRHPAAM